MIAAHVRPDVRWAWRGPSVLVTDVEGAIGGHPLSGYYFRETRYLSRLALRLAGDAPAPASIAQVAPNVLELSQLYPPVESRGGGGSGSGASGRRHGLLFRTLDLDVRLEVRPASLLVRVRLANRWDERAELDVAWELAADYGGIMTSQGHDGDPDPAASAHATADGVCFRWERPELPLETHVRAEGGGAWAWRDGRLATRVSLARQETVELRLEVRPHDTEDDIDRAGEAARERRLAEWERTVTRLHAPGGAPLAALANDAMSELGSLALLDGDPRGWLAPAAGMPLYPALFGRDALTATWQASVFDRGQLIAATLDRLAPLQGTTDDPWRDEQPGRMVQQVRRDPRSRLGETPFARYYGDVASPLLFVLGLGQMYAWSGDAAEVRRHWDAARRVMEWARERGDRDGDGFIEYLTASPQGPRHQAWKDSDNAVVHGDGSQAEPPIAACEIQGYHHVALQFMAALSVAMGEPGEARAYWAQAADLRDRFDRAFWMDDEGCVALGLDAEKRQIRSVTSNAGQCLPCGIVRRDRIPRLVRRMFDADLFSGWGIRTLSTRNRAYQPLSYHLGSVWAVENGTILFGLRRYGFDDRALELARALHDLAGLWAGGRIPECVGGYARWGPDARAHPGAYPHANAPQAWNRSTFAILVQTLLGLRAVAALDTLAVDPVLPPWLPALTVKGLRVGGATVTLRCWRDDDGRSHVEVVERTGTLHVVRNPPVDSLTVGLWDRLGALVQDALPR